MKTQPLFSVPQETRQTARLPLHSQENTPDRTRALGDSVVHVCNSGHRHNLPDAVQVPGAATQSAQNEDRFRLSEGTTAGISASEDTESPKSPAITASKTPPAPSASPSYPPVNVLSKDYVPPEQVMKELVPKPPSSPVLRNDDWLAWLGSKQGECEAPDFVRQSAPLSYITSQLEDRHWVEAAGKDFCFEPLLTTLANMQTFVRHIREGRQFPGKLTPGEDQALAWVEEKTAILLAQGAPYKRTLGLAIAFMIINDGITQRLVIGLTNPGGSQSRLNYIFSELHEDLPPQSLIQYCWGGNNPGAPDEKDKIRRYTTLRSLSRALDVLPHAKNAIVFPSFEPLSVAQFTRFGHLPLYPVGMLTDYAATADGNIQSPAAFMEHDLEHALTIQGTLQRALFGGKDYPPVRPWTRIESALYESEKRLALRRLLLDNRPAALAALGLEPVLELLLFEWFHENFPETALLQLNPQILKELTSAPGDKLEGGSPFLFCIASVQDIRRTRHRDHSPIYQAITETQAIHGALWAARVWELWKKRDFQALPPRSLEECSRSFLANDVPRLAQHTAFIETHRLKLRRMLQRHCNPGGTFSEKFKALQGLYLFEEYSGRSGIRNLDNTDLGYLTALELPGLRQEIEKATGAAVPEGTGESP